MSCNPRHTHQIPAPAIKHFFLLPACCLKLCGTCPKPAMKALHSGQVGPAVPLHPTSCRAQPRHMACMQGSMTAVTSLSQHTQHSSSYQPLLLAVVSACRRAPAASAQHAAASATESSDSCLSTVLNVTDLGLSLPAGAAQLGAANTDAQVPFTDAVGQVTQSPSGLAARLLAGVVPAEMSVCTTMRSTSALPVRVWGRVWLAPASDSSLLQACTQTTLQRGFPPCADAVQQLAVLVLGPGSCCARAVSAASKLSSRWVSERCSTAAAMDLRL
jgi:hypothetical protein